MLGPSQSAQQHSELSILGVPLYSHDGGADASGHRALFGWDGASGVNTEGY